MSKKPPSKKAEKKGPSPAPKKKPRNPVPPVHTTHCTEEQVIAAIKKHNGLLYMVAGELGVTQETVRNYRKRWPKVKEAIVEAKGRRLDVAEKSLDRAIRRGDVKAICFFLDRQGTHRGYGKKIAMKHDGLPPPIQFDQTVIPIEQLSPQLQLQLLRELEAREQESPLVIEHKSHDSNVAGEVQAPATPGPTDSGSVS